MLIVGLRDVIKKKFLWIKKCERFLYPLSYLKLCGCLAVSVASVVAWRGYCIGLLFVTLNAMVCSAAVEQWISS